MDIPEVQTLFRLKLARDTLMSCFEPGLARNDSCLICLDAWDDGPELDHQLIIHAPCRQFFHERCFSIWYANCWRQDILARCPLCAEHIPIPSIFYWRSVHRQARLMQTSLKVQEQRLLELSNSMYTDLMNLVTLSKPVSLVGVRPAKLAVFLHAISTRLHNSIRVRMHSQYIRMFRILATLPFRVNDALMFNYNEEDPNLCVSYFTVLETQVLVTPFTKYTTMIFDLLSGSTRHPALSNAIDQWRDACLQQERTRNHGMTNSDVALNLADQFKTLVSSTIHPLTTDLDNAISSSVTQMSSDFLTMNLIVSDSDKDLCMAILHDYLQAMEVLQTTFESEAEKHRSDDFLFRRNIDRMWRDIAEFRRKGRLSPSRRRMVNRRLAAIMREWGMLVGMDVSAMRSMEELRAWQEMDWIERTEIEGK